MAFHAAHALDDVPIPAGWHGWPGIAGLLYASKRSSPPKVVRATDSDMLLERIAEAEDPLYWRKALAARADAEAELAGHQAQQDAFAQRHRPRPAAASPPRWPGG